MGEDAKKLRSSMTLFVRAAPDEPVLREMLGKYLRGRLDKRTTTLL